MSESLTVNVMVLAGLRRFLSNSKRSKGADPIQTRDCVQANSHAMKTVYLAKQE